MRNKFGDALREARESKGITVSALAEAINVSVPYLSDVERGKRNPFGRRDLIGAAEEELGLAAGFLAELAAGERNKLDVSDLTPGERRRVAVFAQQLRAARAA